MTTCLAGVPSAILSHRGPKLKKSYVTFLPPDLSSVRRRSSLDPDWFSYDGIGMTFVQVISESRVLKNFSHKANLTDEDIRKSTANDRSILIGRTVFYVFLNFYQVNTDFTGSFEVCNGN